MKNAIKYKDTLAMPGSELHSLLTEARNSKDPEKKKEFNKKAEKSYKDTKKRAEDLLERYK